MRDHISYSSVDTYTSCPRKYKYRYMDELEPFPSTDADNPLILGSALHKGMEEDVEAAVKYYKAQFPVLMDAHYEEIMKLEHWIPIARSMVPEGEHEVKVSVPPFVGYIDLMTENEDGTYDLWDFKYASPKSLERYRNSGQLSVYAYYLSKLGKRCRDLHYLVIPKTSIRRKKKTKYRKRDETTPEFRKRMLEDMSEKDITVVTVPYSLGKVADFLGGALNAKYDTHHERKESKLCDWCEYKKFCQEGDEVEIMNLPKCERRKLDYAEKKKIWVYGAPFSGKTVFADKFPDPLMLNTDGNIHNVTAAYVPVKDTVTVTGRQTERTFAWSVLKDAIFELEKKDNDFKTVVLDLVEDAYESCRLYMYDQLGLDHESDDPYRAWDKVRGEFFSVIKRLMNLDYQNIILISHEDMTKDVTKKTGDKVTSIKPNIQDKIANKLAGMVDIVVRAVAEGDKYYLDFSKSEVTFGGGRLRTKIDRIENSYDAICEVYEEANKGAVRAEKPRHEEKLEVEEETPQEPVTEPAEAVEEVETPVEAPEEEPKPVEEPKKRRRRKTRDSE